MKKITQLNSVEAYNKMRGVKTMHPLITVLDLSKATSMPAQTFNFNLYAIYLKELKCGELKYGRTTYDYQDGTMIFIAPGQVMQVMPNVKTFEPLGWALLFHPDLIKGTLLEKNIKKYTFFSYSVNEGLHVNIPEKNIMLDFFIKIQQEIMNYNDEYSSTIIESTLSLLFNYCTRFYSRQFNTKKIVYSHILEQFENVLNNYFSSDNTIHIGLPTVAYCANKLNLSPNYFGDLIKKETGITAQHYIHKKIIEVAKEQMFDNNKSLSNIAYNIGFKFPQHFTRFFKNQVGVLPNEYRKK